MLNMFYFSFFSLPLMFRTSLFGDRAHMQCSVIDSNRTLPLLEHGSRPRAPNTCIFPVTLLSPPSLLLPPPRHRPSLAWSGATGEDKKHQILARWSTIFNYQHTFFFSNEHQLITLKAGAFNSMNTQLPAQ